MTSFPLYPTQTETQSSGTLEVSLTTQAGLRPIPDATIQISNADDPTRIIDEIRTDESGNSPLIELPTPPIAYSSDPNGPQPYSVYNLSITAPGFRPILISGAEIYPTILSLQNKAMEALPPGEEMPVQRFVIPPNTLFGDYPPKIAESEIKPLEESGEIVLSRVVVPEYVIVHDGPPTDRSARNHYVRYSDYIKNVASSEIYATWPEATIYANILAIMSFTLNRIYTEWYRNRGFDFTITSSTAFDHKWISGRNIFDNISVLVDSIFNNYLSRPGITQPILTQYCDGRRVTCPNWMSQWGSKDLGDQGYSAIEILRYYYGSNMYINSADEISGVPSSWPGYDLTIGASGPKVLQLQRQLNTISNTYSIIPKLAEDGVYGEGTAAAVRAFQRQFNLPATGVTDFATWYRISAIYVGVTRIAELT